MGSENGGLWQTMKRNLGQYGRLERREDRLDSGVPDVLYLLRPQHHGPAVAGQVELKYLEKWPSRPGTAVRLSYFTNKQAEYAVKWQRDGGYGGLLLQVGRCYLLLPGFSALALLEGRYTQATLREAATVCVNGKFPVGPLLRALTVEQKKICIPQLAGIGLVD